MQKKMCVLSRSVYLEHIIRCHRLFLFNKNVYMMAQACHSLCLHILDVVYMIVNRHLYKNSYNNTTILCTYQLWNKIIIMEVDML